MKTKIIISLVVFVFISMFIYSRRDLPCRMTIMTKDGDLYNAKRINYYSSGVADVHLCDGQRIIIQTVNIDTIK